MHRETNGKFIGEILLPLRLIGRYDFAIRDYCFKLNLIKLNMEGLSNRIVRSQGSFFRLELVLRNNSKENLHR